MEKLLTISVAAYNVERYIEELLDSLNLEECSKYLEVLIVDDNGSDSTLKKAKKYADKYPDTIKLVHKENGGWGSTVNYSIKNASGKYFRLLDGDDLFEKNNVKKFCELLKSIDSDVVYTPYVRFDDETKKVLKTFKTDNNIQLNKSIDLQQCISCSTLAMHAVTFRTSILRDNNISITEKCFYTDTEYLIKGLLFSKTLFATDIFIYRYRVGRSGQSVDINGLKKHYKDNIKVIKSMLLFFEAFKLDEGNDELIKKYIDSAITFAYNTLIKVKAVEDLKILDDLLVQYEGFSYNEKCIKSLRKKNYRNINRWSRKLIFIEKLHYFIRKIVKIYD